MQDVWTERLLQSIAAEKDVWYVIASDIYICYESYVSKMLTAIAFLDAAPWP